VDADIEARPAPDSARIAFDIDTGVNCSPGGACSGSCEIWHAPATASSIFPVPAAPGDAARFQVPNRSSSQQALGCTLLGWTR
jgi:hypothetical protein